MALTVLETAIEHGLPQCHVKQGEGKDVAAPEQAETAHGGDNEDRPARDDVWAMIQSQKPYVHSTAVRRSTSSLLGQKSLEICTESLGSETGSDGFSDADGGAIGVRSCSLSDDEGGVDVAVAAPAVKAFPPPMPSLARRTVGSTMRMRQHRSDGRLVVDAVPVMSTTLFRAQRRGGRLLLSFADTAAAEEEEEKNDGREFEEETREEEEEEEVQVVDRGTVVEVKVSTQTQLGDGARVHRSSLVINKFVGAEPVNTNDDDNTSAAPQHPPKPPTEASALCSPADVDDGTISTPCESKLLMTTRTRRSKQEVLNHMRRCGQLSAKLFIWEPRVATSS